MSLCYNSNMNIKPIPSVARHLDCDFSFLTKGMHKQSTDGEMVVKPPKKVTGYVFFSFFLFFCKKKQHSGKKNKKKTMNTAPNEQIRFF